MANPFASPSWYKSGPANTVFDSIKNSLLPIMSTEDQRTVATRMASTSPVALGSYANAKFGDTQTKMNSDTRRQFLSADRASKALASMRSMQAVSGYSDATLGGGFKYLQDVVGSLRRLGGTGSGGMTRAQYLEFQESVKNITSSYADDTSESTMAPYATLAQYIAKPTFSVAGNLSDMRNSGTRIMAGVPNARLY